MVGLITKYHKCETTELACENTQKEDLHIVMNVMILKVASYGYFWFHV